jgi:threonine/homoserine/homoserine lactone efflux protein
MSSAVGHIFVNMSSLETSGCKDQKYEFVGVRSVVPEASKLLFFMLAAGVLLVMPGPAVLYIIARSLDQGRLAGLVSVLSIEVGNATHALAAALGLSALLLSSAIAFSIVKYLGAAYLIYLGLRKLLGCAEPRAAGTVPPQRLGRVFSQGVVVAVLNPKTALFFFAFLPQFTDPARGSVPLQMLALGGLFVTMAVISDGAYALLAGSLGQWLKRRSALPGAERYLAGTVYLLLGITAAFTDAGQPWPKG